VERLATADFVLLGERHDNPDHHRLQAWIVDELLAHGRRFAVAFEMIDGDQAPKLASYLAASPGDAHGLGAALDWESSGWPPWALYEPIAAAALAHGAPILAANLPNSVARAMARQGLSALPAPLAERLHLDRVPERPEDRAILAAHEAEIQAVHCGLLPERALAPFALTQYARDAHMAQVMADYWTDHGADHGAAPRQALADHAGVILIAGSGHARSNRGVPFHLARLAPGARIVSLAFVEASEDERATGAPFSALPYDLVWFTAQVDSGDGCDKIRK
jgi:uncharacterized iron-regulated protein